jgi:hypothetical protein
MWYNTLTTHARGYKPIANQPNSCYNYRNPVTRLSHGWYCAVGRVAGFSIWEGEMGLIKDLTGQVFGQLTALKQTDERSDGRVIWLCRCKCGELAKVKSSLLTQGLTKSCGCLRNIGFRRNPTKLIGERFGKLTVVESTEEREYANTVWKCLCDCGNFINVRTGRLRLGLTKDCGCIPKFGPNFVDLVDQRFGLLVVLEVAGRQRYDDTHVSILWKCQCDCGEIKNVAAHNLKSGKTRSCGCREKRKDDDKRIDPVKSSTKYIYFNYKRNAIKRRLEFNLTLDEFSNFLDKPCHYCGIAPNNSYFTYRTVKEFNHEFKYNGIDRIDSSRGYTIENCVTACNQCNKAKLNYTEEEFKDWVKRVHHHLFENGVSSNGCE